MRIIKTTAYKFEELSDEAKETAREWYRSNGFDYEWYDGTFDTMTAIASLIGIDITRIYFSGFWSQGDGACFEGSYSYQKGWKKLIKHTWNQSECGPPSELLSIGSRLQAIQRKYFYLLSASTIQSGHYMHSGCMDVTVDIEDHPNNGYWENIIDAQDEVTECLRKFADWIYRSLEEEYESLSSDEMVDEIIITNEYEFTEDGTLV